MVVAVLVAIALDLFSQKTTGACGDEGAWSSMPHTSVETTPAATSQN